MNNAPVIEDTVFFGKVVTIFDPNDIIAADQCPDLERLGDVNRLGPAAILFKTHHFL